MDYKTIQVELLRAVRGKHSQERVSRKLGFKSNPVYLWETGSRTPSWSQFIKLCRICNRDVERAVHYILGFQGNSADARELLAYLCGTKKITEVARKTGHSRFVVSAWLSGKSEPGLDVFLEIFNELQFILVEFIEVLAPTEQVPSLASVARQLKSQKNAVYAHPEIEAILCALNLETYRKLQTHVPGVIARLIGISLEHETLGIELLKSTGLIFEKDQKFIAKATQIDTQGIFSEAVKIRKYWAKRYFEFLELHRPPEQASRSGYFLIDLSAEGEKQVLQAYQEFCFKLRVIAQNDSGQKKTVKLCNAQLIDLIELGSYLEPSAKLKNRVKP